MSRADDVLKERIRKAKLQQAQEKQDFIVKARRHLIDLAAEIRELIQELEQNDFPYMESIIIRSRRRRFATSDKIISTTRAAWRLEYSPKVRKENTYYILGDGEIYLL